MRTRLTAVSCLFASLFFAALTRGDDLTATVGAQITPNKTALEYGLEQPQQSRPGPSVGLDYRHWFTAHQGVDVEVDYANTNTQLQNFLYNTWTMNRLSLDGAYEYRWTKGKLSPYLKAGLGSLVTLSGRADPPGVGWVGVDTRLEELVGAGLNYRLSKRFSLLAEYECHLFRNPDFSDHSWHPQRNEVSEPKLGITYTFQERR